MSSYKVQALASTTLLNTMTAILMISIPRLDVDFERLVLINSSFYSEVKDNSGNLNTLPNYVTVLKHYADDDITVHKLADFNVNFAHGENYRLLMAEHDMSLFKVVVQAVESSVATLY